MTDSSGNQQEAAQEGPRRSQRGCRRRYRRPIGGSVPLCASPDAPLAWMRPHRWSSRRRMGKPCGKRRPPARAAAAAASWRGTVLLLAQGPAWPGVGSAVNSPAPGAKQPLGALRRLLAALGLLLLGAGDCELHTSCGIQKCTTDFVSFTSHLNAALEDFDLEFCKALRAYSVCTYRNSKVCRGNLVYHSAVLGIGDLMTQRNCTKNGPTSSTNSEITHDPCNYSGHTEVREYQGEEKTSPPTYLFCGLFGDPHLRTFKDHFQTCKVEGAWPLIDNKYLSVQVTNVPLVPGSSATATNKITIIFKSYQDCTDQKVYQAIADDLPAAFVDGTTSGGDEHTRSLHIVEKVGGKYIEMHARYIGTTVYIRQLGHYLTLAIRMPQELVIAYEESQDLQLCVNGCPSSERIDHSGHLPLPVMGRLLPWGAASHAHSGYTLETATTKCHEKMLVKDIYFYSCVFDLLTTGDASFIAAAHSAFQDVEALHPRKEYWHIFPRSGDDGVGRDSKFFVSIGLLCLILFAYLSDFFFRL